MKIASVECLPVYAGWRKNFVFVRVETDSGLVGWGEAYSQYDRDTAIAAQVTELGRYLVGRDPFHIRHILQMAFEEAHDLGKGYDVDVADGLRCARLAKSMMVSNARANSR
jgi:L-alanine-DL-glutamate epimerase-like enolase superfamily enzyme